MTKVKIDMTPRDLMRAQDVKRWQIVRVREGQSVAQHSWAVAMIAMDLWLRKTGGKPGEAATDVELGRIAVAALWHDVPEVFTGDINTPTKIYIKEKLASYTALEDLEDTAGDSYACAMALTEPERVCLKVADFLEAIYYLSEHGDGNYAQGQLYGLQIRLGDFCNEKPEGDIWRRLAGEVEEALLVGPETTTFNRVNSILAQRPW